MNIWRLHTKSGEIGRIMPEKAAQFWIDEKIFGTGWRISKEEEEKLGDLDRININEWHHSMCDIVGKSDSNLLQKNYNAIKGISCGDFIVIRKKGVYYMGKVNTEHWQYINTEVSEKYDTHLIRTVDNYFEIGLIDSIPGKVVNNFRVSKHCNRIADDSAISVLKMLYNDASQSNEFEVDKISIDDFLGLLQPEDLEELVSIYLQVEKNCILFSSTNKLDTQAYEFVMVQKETGSKVIAQVKQGNVSVLDTFFTPFLESSEQTNTKREIYIYDKLSENIENNDVIESNEFCSVIRISKVELLLFFESHLYLMPKRIQTMYEYITKN